MKKQIGDKIGKYTVVGTQDIIHGKLFPNKGIIQIICLSGQRGAKFRAYVNNEGIATNFLRNYGFFEGQKEALDGR